jgi:hypothetical protein
VLTLTLDLIIITLVRKVNMLQLSLQNIVYLRWELTSIKLIKHNRLEIMNIMHHYQKGYHSQGMLPKE